MLKQECRALYLRSGSRAVSTGGNFRGNLAVVPARIIDEFRDQVRHFRS